MKGIKFLILVVLISFNFLVRAISGKVEYGKIIVRIIDKETGAPVNEQYKIILNGIEIGLSYFKTNKNGYFSGHLLPMKYSIQCVPILEEKSKYREFRNIRKIFTLNPGKIVEIKIYVQRGGKLKLCFLDSNGARLNLNQVTGNKADAAYHVALNFPEKKVIWRNGYKNPNFENGELLITNLPARTYNVVFSMDNNKGYISVRKDGINIEKNKTTEIELEMKCDISTGVEGIVRDEKGNLVVGREIRMYGEDYSGISLQMSTKTDNNGYYKIINPFVKGKGQEDVIFIDYKVKIAGHSRDFYIIKNKFARKDIVIKE